MKKLLALTVVSAVSYVIGRKGIIEERRQWNKLWYEQFMKNRAT